jgi:hypothetical protein
MPTKRTAIPLCRSPFLQDITIALGRRSLKSLRQVHSILIFTVSKDEVDGIICERFDIEACNYLGNMTKITIWEDAASWVHFVKCRDKASRSGAFEKHANLAGMNVENVAELIRGTLHDFESVKHVWQEHAVST